MAIAIVKDADLTEEQAQEVYSQILTCEPLMSQAEANRLADMVFNQERFIRYWRLTAISAEKGGDFYREVSEDQERAKGLMIEVVPRLKEFEEIMLEMSELANCVATRIIVAASNHEASTEWGEDKRAIPS